MVDVSICGSGAREISAKNIDWVLLVVFTVDALVEPLLALCVVIKREGQRMLVIK